MFYHLHAHQAANRDNTNADQCQHRADHQHHYEYKYHGTDGCNNLADALLKGGIYGVHIIGDAAQHISECIAVKIGQRQTADFLVYCHAQIMHCALRHSCHNVLAGIVEQKSQYIHTAQLYQNSDERSKSLEDPGAVHGHGHQRIHGPAKGIWPLGGKHGSHHKAGHHENDSDSVWFHKTEQTAHGALGIDFLICCPHIHLLHALISSSDNWLRTISW